MKILAISGSLRKDSFNSALLRTMQMRSPENVTIEIADIAAIPLYNGDLDNDSPPSSVVEFKAAISSADALIMATPEYNYSVSGVIKNAIDWASRPAYNSVLKDKNVGIISASMAFTGGVRAQQHLKTILSGTLSKVIVVPEVLIAGAHNLIKDGNISDEQSLSHIDALLDAVIKSNSAKE